MLEKCQSKVFHVGKGVKGVQGVENGYRFAIAM